MKKIFAKFVIGFMVLAVMAITLASPPRPARTAQPGTDTVLLWKDYMIRTVIMNGKQPPPASFVYGAYAQAAGYNAVVAITGGYQPGHLNGGGCQGCPQGSVAVFPAIPPG